MVPLNVGFVWKFNVTLPDCPAVMLTVCGVAVSANDGGRGCTTTLSIAEVAASWLGSPLYAAVMVLVPAGRPDSASCTVLLPLSGTLPNGALHQEENVTLPVGAGEPRGTRTTACNVTVDPCTTVVGRRSR